MCFFFFFQAEDGIRDGHVTGVQTCALPISSGHPFVTRVTRPVTPVTPESALRDDRREMNVRPNGAKVGYGFWSTQDGPEQGSHPGVVGRSEGGGSFAAEHRCLASSGHLRPPVLERISCGPRHLGFRPLRRGAPLRVGAGLGGGGGPDSGLAVAAMGPANRRTPQA